MIVDWSHLKSFVDERSLSIQEVLINGIYYLKAFDGSFTLETTINKKSPADSGSDQEEYETSYQPNKNQKLAAPKNIDSRDIIHTTPRAFGSVTYFTGAGDDGSNEYTTGGANGVSIAWKHAVSESMTQNIVFDINSIENKTYLHAGALQWKDALNDEVTFEVIPKLTTYSAGSNTDYTLYGGYLIIPSNPGAGDITVDAGDRVLVEVPLNEKGDRVGSGYYDADWNTSTKAWENFAINYAGTGQFNMFAAEVALDRFANRLTLLGSGMSPLGTHDASMFGHNNRCKLTYKTIGTDHEWYGNCWLVLHRKRTT